MEPPKKPLDEVLEIFKESAEKYMKKFREDILKILSECSEHIVGIFANYKTIYDDEKCGEDLLDMLSRKFVEMGFSVITGKAIYYRHDGKIIMNDFITHAIDTLTGMTNDQKKVLKFFATIPPRAVFLLHKEKGAMAYEIDAFSEADDKDLGVGFVRVEEPKSCGLLEKNVDFCCCKGENKIHCKDNEGLCPFYEQAGIDHTSNLMFVVSSHMLLATIKNYNDIPKASVELFKIYCT
jgi:hypothetical protein